MRQTVVGVFDGFEAARHAAELLRQRGIDGDDIHVAAAHDDEDDPADATAPRDTRDPGLLQRVKDFFTGAADDDDVGGAPDPLRRGGALVAVDVDIDDIPRVDTARRVLEEAGAVDIDDRSPAWRPVGGPDRATTRDDDRDRYPDALSGGGDTEGHRTGLGTRPGVGGGADVPVATSTSDPGYTAGTLATDPGYAADPDDLIARGRGEQGLSVEHPGGIGQNRPPGPTARREGEPLDERPLTVPDTEVRQGLSSSVTPPSRAQAGSAAAQDLSRRSEQASSASQDDDRRDPGALRVDVRIVDDRLHRPEDRLGPSADRGPVGGTDTDAFDETAYRSDFDARHGGGGDRWEHVEPAYRHGHTLARDERYRGHDWDTVEPDARADWERRHGPAGGGSTWEQVKGAVRHAWERARR